MHITARCHCGQISYEAELDPEKVAVCHCSDCQSLSGTAFRTVGMVADKDLTLLTGTPKVYVKTAESGNRREQAFCGNCGSALWATSQGDGPKVLGLRLGVVEQRATLTPKVQIWAHSAMPWLSELDDVKKVEGQP